MDKSWIHIRNRLDPTYIEGVEKFIEFVYENKQPNSKIYCPCEKCSNLRFETRKGVKEHLVINGFDTKYTRWTIHGELVASSSEMDANQDSDFLDDMVGMVHDAFGVPGPEFEGLESTGLGADDETKKGGVDLDRIEVFTKTHTKRNGNPVDEASSLAIRRLEEGASQIPPDSSERAALREELFTEVLKPDRNGWLRTYGLGPCQSQVFGTRYTRSQDQRIKDQLRAEVRQEVLAEVGGEIDPLKREYARMAAHMAGIGHPLPPSPNGNGDGDRDVGGDHTQSMSEHN